MEAQNIIKYWIDTRNHGVELTAIKKLLINFLEENNFRSINSQSREHLVYREDVFDLDVHIPTSFLETAEGFILTSFNSEWKQEFFMQDVDLLKETITGIINLKNS